MHCRVDSYFWFRISLVIFSKNAFTQWDSSRSYASFTLNRLIILFNQKVLWWMEDMLVILQYWYDWRLSESVFGENNKYPGYHCNPLEIVYFYRHNLKTERLNLVSNDNLYCQCNVKSTHCDYKKEAVIHLTNIQGDMATNLGLICSRK